jgi:hypothetical protein
MVQAGTVRHQEERADVERNRKRRILGKRKRGTKPIQTFTKNHASK